MKTKSSSSLVRLRMIEATWQLMAILPLALWPFSGLSAPSDSLSTSTEWRDDEANIQVVRELNRAYARLPFSREFEGVLDQCPYSFTWTTGPNVPVPWKGGVAGMLGDDIVLVGGLWMPGYKHLAYAYNLKTRTYQEIPPPPFKTEYTQGACDGTNVYVVGGRAAGRNVAKLSRTGDGRWQWTALRSLPESEGNGRWLAVAAVIPGKWLFLVAGHPTGTPSEDRGKPAMADWRLRLDRPDSQWEPMAPYPGGPRALLASAVVGGKLYVFGGSHPDPVMREVFEKLVKDHQLFNAPYAGAPEYRDCYSYDSQNNQWNRIRSLPFPMHGGTCVVLNERYILLMGTTETKTLRVGRSDMAAMAGVASRGKSKLEQGVLPYWTGYNDLILCYDVEKDNYSRIGVMLYGVATCPWVTDGHRLYGFGGEPYHCYQNNNTETVLQIGSIHTPAKTP